MTEALPVENRSERSEGKLWLPLCLVVLLLAVRISMSLYTGYTSDDAFITYRYAENLAEGHGWVYNLGEKVQGTSSPLYTMILSAVGSIGEASAIPTASKIVSIASDIATLFIVWHLLASISLIARFIAVVSIALYPKVVLIGISGMEASLVVMLMLLGLYLLVRRNSMAACFVFGLLLMTRFDAIAWVAVVLILAWVFKEDLPTCSFMVLILIVGSWAVFSHFYFGTWIPHSVIAKRVSWLHLFPAFDPVRVLLGYFPFQGLTDWPSFARHAAVLIFLVPPIVEGVRLFRIHSWLIAFPVFFLLYNLAFSFGRVLMTDWYYLPGYLAYFVSLATLVDHLVRRWQIDETKFLVRAGIPGSLVALLIASLYGGTQRWKDDPAGLFLRQNQQLGIWLKEHSIASSRVMLEPVGYVGWESKLHFDDYIGLVSPRVVSYRLRFPNSDAWFMQFVKDTEPDYIVLRNWEVPRNQLFHGHGDGLFQSEFDREWFELMYTPVQWNPRAAEKDSVYLVLYQHIAGPSMAGGNLE